MFKVTLTYLVDLFDVDAASPEHGVWSDQQYADSVFVASGRQVPGAGGIIRVAGIGSEDLERRLLLDPFGQRWLAEHAIVQFEPRRVCDGLERLLRKSPESPSSQTDRHTSPSLAQVPAITVPQPETVGKLPDMLAIGDTFGASMGRRGGPVALRRPR